MSLSLDGATGNITGLGVLRPQLPSGAIIQTVKAQTTTEVSITSHTFTDTTLSASITTTGASSKVLVLVDQQIQYYHANGSSQGCGLRLLRDATAIHTPLGDTSSSYEYWMDSTGSTTANVYSRVHLMYLDTPGAAGTYTYKTQGRPYRLDAVTPVNGILRAQNAPSSGTAVGTSYITLLEIA